MVGVLPSIVHFYPRPPRGGRRPSSIKTGVVELFLSTPSARRATIPPIAPSVPHRQFLSTPSARRATEPFIVQITASSLFLSTPSARRATTVVSTTEAAQPDFYPRPPRGGRRVSRRSPRRLFDFYPRPPRGGRLFELACAVLRDGFLSTPSARRATSGEHDHKTFVLFLSTPSARRATSTMAGCRQSCSNFYPRPPRGGRRFLFSSMCSPFSISIHALREEGDGR